MSKKKVAARKKNVLKVPGEFVFKNKWVQAGFLVKKEVFFMHRVGDIRKLKSDFITFIPQNRLNSLVCEKSVSVIIDCSVKELKRFVKDVEKAGKSKILKKKPFLRHFSSDVTFLVHPKGVK